MVAGEDSGAVDAATVGNIAGYWAKWRAEGVCKSPIVGHDVDSASINGNRLGLSWSFVNFLCHDLELKFGKSNSAKIGFVMNARGIRTQFTAGPKQSPFMNGETVLGTWVDLRG